MHCAEVEGQNIAVQLYTPRRTSGTVTDFNAAAPSFVPASPQYTPYPTQVRVFIAIYLDLGIRCVCVYLTCGLVGLQYSPPRAAPFPVRSPGPFVHGPGQQVQLAPLSGPGSASHSGLIDPCNLFCKVRDMPIDSEAAFLTRVWCRI